MRLLDIVRLRLGFADSVTECELSVVLDAVSDNDGECDLLHERLVSIEGDLVDVPDTDKGCETDCTDTDFVCDLVPDCCQLGVPAVAETDVATESV